jgi:hypothetical protein
VREAFYRLGTRASDISDLESDISDLESDISGPDRIYLANSDLAKILQKTKLYRIYPMILGTDLEKVLEISNFSRI